jgi:pantoate--beta-alanine ligase
MKIKIFETIESLQNWLHNNDQSKSIGFVPTMGALHDGHIQLINRARAENEIVVCSVFVNPTQFNNASDLAKYPRNIENDILMLEAANCDAVFTPPEEVMYPDGNDLLAIDLAGLDEVMEGIFRPGHFAGMVTIVHKLLNIVKPHRAYFGEKDFQQLAIINYMVKQLNMSVSIIGCPTVRESDGLAMSSRNIHLTTTERQEAPVIYNTLKACADQKNKMNPAQLQQWVKNEIEQSGLFKVEYIAFVDGVNLLDLKEWKNNIPQRACIAVTTSKTRLIDNVAV